MRPIIRGCCPLRFSCSFQVLWLQDCFDSQDFSLTIASLLVVTRLTWARTRARDFQEVSKLINKKGVEVAQRQTKFSNPCFVVSYEVFALPTFRVCLSTKISQQSSALLFFRVFSLSDQIYLSQRSARLRPAGLLHLMQLSGRICIVLHLRKCTQLAKILTVQRSLMLWCQVRQVRRQELKKRPEKSQLTSASFNSKILGDDVDCSCVSDSLSGLFCVVRNSEPTRKIPLQTGVWQRNFEKTKLCACLCASWRACLKPSWTLIGKQPRPQDQKGSLMEKRVEQPMRGSRLGHFRPATDFSREPVRAPLQTLRRNFAVLNYTEQRPLEQDNNATQVSDSHVSPFAHNESNIPTKRPSRKIVIGLT